MTQIVSQVAMELQRHEWAVVLIHLETALDLPVTERKAWLDQLLLESTHLKAALRRMLADRAAIETDDFLGRGAAASLLEPGSRVGPWLLLRELGHGGMARVWLAQRSDGAHARQVALKLPYRTIGSTLMVDRFARERQILSTLQHPNIAQVLDAGAAGDQPWLALEYVEGDPITDHAASLNLSVRQRVELFLPVLRAIAHAHAQLIIHRDIKPANVLVAGDGTVKLLDFGVAKLLDPGGLAQETALTRWGGRALTPQYASPEQVAGRPLGVASDVYSLGVLLYELLTGCLPYRVRRDTAAALEEAILDAQVQRPSQVVVDKFRARALRGDIDAIVGKAMQLEVANRYPSAESFARDLSRYLGRQAVLAQPASARYRLGKFISRWRVQVVAGSAVALALALGVGVSLWQARTARVQADRANAEAATARAVQDFIGSVFRANSGDQSSPAPARAATARDLLDRGADRIDGELSNQPQARLHLLGVLASMYEDMGELDRCLALQSKRLALAREMAGPTSDESVLALADAAGALTNLERLGEANELLDEASRALDARQDTTSVARMKVELRRASLRRRDDPAAGLAAGERALTIARGAAPSSDLVIALVLVGENALYTEHYEHARTALQEVVQLLDTRPELGASLLSGALSALGDVYARLNKPGDAIAAYRRGLLLARQRGDGPVLQHLAAAKLGNYLREHGQARESLDILEPAYRWARQQTTDLAQPIPFVTASYGRALLESGSSAEGLKVLDEAAEQAAKLPDAIELHAAVGLFRATALADLGRLAEAEQAVERAAKIIAERHTRQEYLLEPVRAHLKRARTAEASPAPGPLRQSQR